MASPHHFKGLKVDVRPEFRLGSRRGGIWDGYVWDRELDYIFYIKDPTKMEKRVCVEAEWKGCKNKTKVTPLPHDLITT